MIFTLNWDLIRKCLGPVSPDCTDRKAYFRFDGVASSANYAFSLSYATDEPGNFDVPVPDWYKRSGAVFTNLADSSSQPPTAGYAFPAAGVEEVTVPGGRTWRFTSSGMSFAIRRPGGNSDTMVVNYASGGIVTSVVREGVTTTYERPEAGKVLVKQVLGSETFVTEVVSDLSKGRPVSVKDPLEHTTLFAYDAHGRLESVEAPEGNRVIYAYDARGNVTSTRLRDKSGNPANDIVTSATYPDPTAPAPRRNKPLTTTDARLKTTDYVWNPDHGGLEKIILPSPDGTAPRPETRYTWEPVTAVTGQPVMMQTASSACITGGPPCSGADEARTQTVYETANLLPRSVSAGSGAGMIATSILGYDPIGNLVSVDRPLSGAADTTRFVWNSARERVGTISPDPDEGVPGTSGALPRRAERVTYRPDGQVEKVEQGTIAHPDVWSGFVPAQAVETSFDPNTHRPVAARLTAGAAIHSLTQTSYDALGRVDCVVQRMNPADFASPPANACGQGTPESPYGPDRIAKTQYNARGEVTTVTVALGTGAQAHAVRTDYTPNGLTDTLTDANGNVTDYSYDLHDRLELATYPPHPVHGVRSEEWSYDPNGNILSFRNRANETIAYSYDYLNRMTLKNRPGTEPDVTYAYDNLGRLTSALQANENMSFTYDALGRLESQTNPLGTVRAEYDAAGRRTKLTWPHAGTQYVEYDRLVTGELHKVRESGASSGAGLLAVYGYDSLGRRTSIARGNGTSTSYANHPVFGLETLTHSFAGSSVEFEFEYNPAGQIDTVQRDNDAFAWTRHASGTTQAGVNALNQLDGWNGSLTHDAKGNVSSYGTTNYSWTSENLLATLGTTPVRYDPTMRFAFVSGIRFLRFQDQFIGEYYNGNVVQRYVPGDGLDDTVAEIHSNGTRYQQYADERGSIVAEAPDTGVATPYSYDEYGRPGTASGWRIGFTGQLRLGSTTPLYDFRNRLYDARIGRFLQADPIGYSDGMNMYAYVGGDPVNKVDPTGRCYYENYTMHIYDKYGNDLGPDPKDPESWSEPVGCNPFSWGPTGYFGPGGAGGRPAQGRPAAPRQSQALINRNLQRCGQGRVTFVVKTVSFFTLLGGGSAAGVVQTAGGGVGSFTTDFWGFGIDVGVSSEGGTSPNMDTFTGFSNQISIGLGTWSGTAARAESTGRWSFSGGRSVSPLTRLPGSFSVGDSYTALTSFICPR
jgi:RHS repeat-associated protein